MIHIRPHLSGGRGIEGSLMADLKLLSWNVQKYGARKAHDQAFREFVADLIIATQADLVGLMEIVGWIGQDVRNNLVATLNQKAQAPVWQGEESEMTPSKPHEQYVFLWNTTKIKVTKQYLWGVVGDDAFRELFTACKFDQTLVQRFWQVMISKGYLDSDFSVAVSGQPCQDLVHIGAKAFDLTPGFIYPFTPANKQVIAETLLTQEIVGFPYRNSRPPYLAECTLVPGGGAILVTLFHAPGPTGSWPMLSTNTLSGMKPVQISRPSVIMGDFNVGQAHMTQVYTVTALDPNGRPIPFLVAGHPVALQPFQALTGPSHTGFATLDYKLLLRNDLTSLTTGIGSRTFVPDDLTIGNVLSSPYDKFLVAAAAPASANARALNVIDSILPKQDVLGDLISKTSSAFLQSLSDSAVQAFVGWFDDQSSHRFPPAILTHMDGTGSMIDSLSRAHYVYRYAISDHLPVLLELKNL